MQELVETKIRCSDLRPYRKRLVEAGGSLERSIEQRDTYFRVAAGWLKLRVSAGTSQLVAYHRHAGPNRLCVYTTIDVADPESCRRVFLMVLGVLVDVVKHREEWRLGSTVVHLDKVADLGSFVELETTVAPGTDAGQAHSQCQRLLGVEVFPDLRMSYADLLLTESRR